MFAFLLGSLQNPNAKILKACSISPSVAMPVERISFLLVRAYSKSRGPFVISPEGCANIIWKTSDKAPQAAQAMGVTSENLIDLGVVDESIEEPLGGAHRNIDEMSDSLRNKLLSQVDALMRYSIDDLLENRYQRLMAYGKPPQ